MMTKGLFEGNAQSFAVTPDQAAWPLDGLRQNTKHQAVGDVQNAFQFQRSPARRQVLDRAADGAAAAEFDQASLEGSVTLRRAAFEHAQDR